jgi:acyl-CoA thioesterase FadM
MTVRHHREALFGEPFVVETWVSTFRRGLVSHREVRVTVDGDPVVSATQEWVHVRTQPSLSPTRAAPELIAALTPLERGPHVELPPYDDVQGLELEPVALPIWYTSMDPLAHANHPAYIDWCDEALCRRVATAGFDPQGLVPAAETVVYKSGATAPETVSVHARIVGRRGDQSVLENRIVGGDGRLCAVAITLRSHLDGPAALQAAHEDGG